MLTHDTAVFFWGGIFSNFAKVQFEYEGHTFFTTEQAFMWEKARFFNDEETADLVLKEHNPKKAKELGRQVKNFDPVMWDDISFQIMYNVNKPKWELWKAALLKTGDKILVEASPFDKIWGIGLGSNDPRIMDKDQWQGQNRLGDVLMKLRNDLA